MIKYLTCDYCDTAAADVKQSGDCYICDVCENDFMAELDNYDDYGDFADPGGNSALRAETHSNPRDSLCPTCLRPNVLTRKDVALGYQCNACVNQAEMGY